MSCPTCDHTMQNVGGSDHRTYWCPRCGTLRECGTKGLIRDTPPTLVVRCRMFEGRHAGDPAVISRWVQDGVAESINPPGDRIQA